MLHCFHEFRFLFEDFSTFGPITSGEKVTEVEEMLHYACEANGSVYAIVPDKLLCFPTPAYLPAGQDWLDDKQGSAIVRQMDL